MPRLSMHLNVVTLCDEHINLFLLHDNFYPDVRPIWTSWTLENTESLVYPFRPPMCYFISLHPQGVHRAVSACSWLKSFTNCHSSTSATRRISSCSTDYYTLQNPLRYGSSCNPPPVQARGGNLQPRCLLTADSWAMMQNPGCKRSGTYAPQLGALRARLLPFTVLGSRNLSNPYFFPTGLYPVPPSIRPFRRCRRMEQLDIDVSHPMIEQTIPRK